MKYISHSNTSCYSYPINLTSQTKSAFGKNYFCQLILLFSLFLLLFMGPVALFDTIYGSHYTISTNFYLYLQYFQQKVFNFSKKRGSQIDLKIAFFFWVAFMDYFILFFLKNLTQNHVALCFGYRKVNDNFAHNSAY